MTGLYLTTNELNEAMETCVRIAQHDSFLEEIKLVHNDYQLPKRSPLKSLNVFVDKKGILRVGGRLNAADMSYQQKHRIVLQKTHHLTRIITRHLHLLYMHAGPRLLFSVVNQTYWIVGCHNLIRGIVRKCVTCTRHRASSMIQQMSALPRARVQPGRPFSNTGVDYGGPITLKTWKGRGAKLMKGYICLFVCLATKAIHLEAVSELSSQAFLAAFRRFITRRGYCTAIWSDNGTNFVGANRELKETLNFIRSSDNQDSIANELSNKGIQWNFIPPSAPHFGGLWEAGIKSVKHHLKRTIGEAKLTFEEFATVLCQIEACLNSRPLSAAPTDTGEPEIITPNHFLIGGSAMIVPDINYDCDSKISPYSRWKYLQSLQQLFWKRWKLEYLSSLQQRTKWEHPRPNITINTIVIIKDDNSPPGSWRMGRVISVHEGSDQLIRVVTIKTKDGIFKRPISKIIVLPVEPQLIN